MLLLALRVALGDSGGRAGAGHAAATRCLPPKAGLQVRASRERRKEAKNKASSFGVTQRGFR